MKQEPPINTIPLFPLLEKKLIELVRSLTPEEWNKQTVAKQWTVKDVAAHLLDGNLRVISRSRDKYVNFPAVNIQSNQDLVNYLNRLNNDWVNAMKRVSPELLLEWMEATGSGYIDQFAGEDLYADAVFAVSWAGDTTSPNWFHIAREYTERWHHQQQIRDAVNKPGIMTKELYYPCLDTFMMALPYTYRLTEAPEGTVVQCSITGEGGGDWYLVMKNGWMLSKTPPSSPVARTIIDGSVAWKLFSKSWRRNDVKQYTKLEGDQRLADVMLDMISVVA
jgi:uncharacterized protein (TIGR03083 family)